MSASTFQPLNSLASAHGAKHSVQEARTEFFFPTLRWLSCVRHFDASRPVASLFPAALWFVKTAGGTLSSSHRLMLTSQPQTQNRSLIIRDAPIPFVLRFQGFLGDSGSAKQLEDAAHDHEGRAARLRAEAEEAVQELHRDLEETQRQIRNGTQQKHRQRRAEIEEEFKKREAELFTKMLKYVRMLRRILRCCLVAPLATQCLEAEVAPIVPRQL